MITKEQIINKIIKLKSEIEQEKNIRNKQLLEERIIVLEELLYEQEEIEHKNESSRL